MRRPMLGVGFLLFSAIGFSYHVGQFAPERGRGATSWILLTLAGIGAGFGLGSLLLAWLMQPFSSAPPLLAIVFNPYVLGFSGALAVTVALHGLPAAAAQLSGSEWQFDRLDTEQRVRLRMTDTLRILAEADELVLRPSDLERGDVDGECLLLELREGTNRKSIALRPTGLPSRETRARFAEAVRDRIAAMLSSRR